MDRRTASVVEVENLVKHYSGVKAVDGISYAVHQEETFGMVGPNGAGKTTIIECIEVAMLAGLAIVGTFIIARTFRWE